MSINERVIENVIYRRLAPFLLVLALVIAIVAAVGTFANSQAIARANAVAIESAADDAVTACENANESREGVRAAWNFVADLLGAGDRTPEQIAFADEFRAWVNKLYQPHDCSDLSKSYPLPPPPATPAN